MGDLIFTDDIQDIYLLCPTELGVRNSTDWCDLMTEQEREVVNYEHDLEVGTSWVQPNKRLKVKTKKNFDDS